MILVLKSNIIFQAEEIKSGRWRQAPNARLCAVLSKKTPEGHSVFLRLMSVAEGRLGHQECAAAARGGGAAGRRRMTRVTW